MAQGTSFRKWIAVWVCLALAAPSVPQAQQAAPAAPAPAVDTVEDVTVVARPTYSEDVAGTRFGRTAFRCGVSDSFNQVYYAELTGRADSYDAAKVKAEQAMQLETLRKLNRRRPSRGGPPPRDIFANLSYMPEPGRASIQKLGCIMCPMPPPPPIPYSGCLTAAGRDVGRKNTTFARALALYDKGQHAQALPLFAKARDEFGAFGFGTEAALMMAKIYLSAGDVPVDAAKAIGWLEKVVATRIDTRTPDKDPNGVTRYRPEEPDRFYTAPAEAAMIIAQVYMTGQGLPKNPAKARQWVETAAFAGHVPASKLLGDFHHAGYGGPQTYDKALTYYTAAGDMGHAAAKSAAAGMYLRGEGASPNPDKAWRLYREAAQLGDPDAAYALAVAYEAGRGVPVDPKKAADYYKTAALKGQPGAQTAMGTYFYEGVMVPKDHPMARTWFESAASRGDADGMVNLAAMLIRGEGGPPDLVKAWAWLSLARGEGRDDVGPGLAGLERKMSPADMAAARSLIARYGAGSPS